MSRGLTAAMVTALSGVLRPALFVQIEWATGATYYWTGFGSIAWDSKTWIGGKIMRVAAIAETTELRAAGIEIALAGVDSADLALALNQARMGKAVQVWLGLLDSAGAVIADPYPCWNGRLDTVEILEDAAAPSIAIRAEHELVALTRSRTLRYTPEQQKVRYPGDKGLDFLPKLQSWSGQWGTAPMGNNRFWRTPAGQTSLVPTQETGGP